MRASLLVRTGHALSSYGTSTGRESRAGTQQTTDKIKVMKQIILLFILVGFAIPSQCQQTSPEKVVTSDYLLKKSKRQSTAASILLAGGAALVGTSFSAESAGVIAIVGTLSALGSIPLFIASSKNKRKARNMTGQFKLEHYSSPTVGIGSKAGPALAIRLNF